MTELAPLINNWWFGALQMFNSLDQQSKVKGHNTWRANPRLRADIGEDYLRGISHHVRIQAIESEHHISDTPCADFSQQDGLPGNRRSQEVTQRRRNKEKASDADPGRRGRGGRWWWRPSWRSSRWSCRWRALGSWARPPLMTVSERFASELDLLAGALY